MNRSVHSIRRRTDTGARALALALGLWFAVPALPAQRPADPSQAAPPPEAAVPRGKKLMLKDGSFQIVREFQIVGDRVRYYSLDTSQWEEVPAAQVDWDATKKIEAQQLQHDAAVVAAARAREAARRVETLDIDASMEASPGVFLPPGAGLFAFDGTAVLPLTQAQTDVKLSKGKLLEQVLVPIPIVPSRHIISIPGTRAALRLATGQPEFYMRTEDAREPTIELIHAKIRDNTRVIENIDEIFGQHQVKGQSLPMQRWQLAPGVYRFTVGKPLDAGEYVLTEILQDQGTAVYVWDFGVNAGAKPKTGK